MINPFKVCNYCAEIDNYRNFPTIKIHVIKEQNNKYHGISDFYFWGLSQAFPYRHDSHRKETIEESVREA